MALSEKCRNITQVMMHQRKVCADIREVVALKEVWQNRNQAKQLEVASPQIPSLSMSQSEVHMRSVLQNKYVAGDPATNVRTMFETYFAKGVAKGVKEPLIEQLIDFIKREQQLGDEQVFVYHAANDVIAFAYEVYTKLYQTLMAKERQEVFRAQGHYFKPFANMAEFMAYYSQNNTQNLNNYAQGFNECALSTNLFLFGNHRDDRSRSVRYLLTNFVNRGRLSIKNYYELENALKKIPDESRMAFACRHQQHVRTQENLVSIIDLLPENQRLEFAKNHADKIQRTIGTLNLIEKLPPTQRFDFFQSLPDAVTILPDLAFALRAFTEAEKLLLIEAKAHLLCNGHQLTDLLDNIEPTARYGVACKYADCIRDTHELRSVLHKLQPTTQTAFANLNKELINQPEDLSEVAQGLPEDERHPFALSMQHKLCTSTVVFRMIGMVLPAERSYYVPLLEKYLNDIPALQLLLKYTPQAQWIEVIERNINKINVNFNGFMTKFFDTYCPNECPPSLAKLFQKQRDSDGVSDFIGFIRDIKRLNVSVYLSAFQITVVNIEQILAILKRTPTAQQLQFLGQYDSIIFADANNIIRVLDVLHESHRASYVLAVGAHIPANENRLGALARLPAEHRLGYVDADPNWFAWSPSLKLGTTSPSVDLDPPNQQAKGFY